jgi:AcrR family transcriptional regulator
MAKNISAAIRPQRSPPAKLMVNPDLNLRVPRIGRPSLEEASGITQAVLDAALQEFRRKGFAGASLEQIAIEAKITKNALYRRFADKESLFVAVVAHRIDMLKAMAEQARRNTGDPLMALCKTTRTYLEFILSPISLDLQRILIAEAVTFPHLAKILAVPTPVALTERLDQLIVSAQQSNQLRAGSPIVWRDLLLSLATEGPRWRALIGVEPWSSDELDAHLAKRWPCFLKLAGKQRKQGRADPDR